jgi:hypothetical protein
MFFDAYKEKADQDHDQEFTWTIPARCKLFLAPSGYFLHNGFKWFF